MSLHMNLTSLMTSFFVLEYLEKCNIQFNKVGIDQLFMFKLMIIIHNMYNVIKSNNKKLLRLNVITLQKVKCDI